jgi:hypothetical protein
MFLAEELAGIGYATASAEITQKRSRVTRNATKAPYRKVYFVRHLDTGAIKIGRSSDPVRRLRQLHAAFGGRMELIGYVDGAITETTLIRHLSRWSLGKEWFQPSEQVMDVVNRCLEKGLGHGVELATFYSFDE